MSDRMDVMGPSTIRVRVCTAGSIDRMMHDLHLEIIHQADAAVRGRRSAATPAIATAVMVRLARRDRIMTILARCRRHRMTLVLHVTILTAVRHAILELSRTWVTADRLLMIVPGRTVSTPLLLHQ